MILLYKVALRGSPMFPSLRLLRKSFLFYFYLLLLLVFMLFLIAFICFFLWRIIHTVYLYYYEYHIQVNPVHGLRPNLVLQDNNL